MAPPTEKLERLDAFRACRLEGDMQQQGHGVPQRLRPYTPVVESLYFLDVQVLIIYIRRLPTPMTERFHFSLPLQGAGGSPIFCLPTSLFYPLLPTDVQCRPFQAQGWWVARPRRLRGRSRTAAPVYPPCVAVLVSSFAKAE
eukprot:6121692-Pyramimonas_sp.AAC.1